MAIVDKIVMAKLEGAKGMAAAKAAAGKTFIVSKATTLGNMVILQPVAGAAKMAGTGAVTLKLESAKQVAGLKAMVGKTVTVGKLPAAGGNWLVLKPGAVVAGKTATLATGAATGSAFSLAKVEGAKQATQVKALMGKTFTVIDPATVGQAGKGVLLLKPSGAAAIKAAATMSAVGGGKAAAELEGAAAVKAAGAKVAAGGAKAAAELEGAAAMKGAGAKAAAMKGAGGMKGATTSKGLVTIKLAGKKQALAFKGMIGKKVTIDAPLLAGKGGAGNWFALKTVPCVATKATAGVGVAKGAAMSKSVVGSKMAMTGKAVGTKGTLAASALKGTAATGTIWTGTGWSLGLGLGLGSLGPAMLGAAAAGAGYAYYRKKNKSEDDVSDDADLDEAFLSAIS